MKSHASMNRIYRLVWNAALNLWVAVAENAKGRGKSGSARNKAALLMLVPLSALMHQARAADAANATVSAGAASVATAGNTTTINQASQRAAIDWTSLSTRANEALVFNQPNAQAIALNRITGTSPSELLGSLTANGQVFILNPNGVLFGAGSQVNVGGLVASTLSLSNADFEAGNYKFTGSGGSIVNQGTLNAAPGGYLALLAPEVRNEGVMTASLGTALLAAGNKVTLNLDNGSLLGYSIDQGAINALAENKQLIQANGGQVLLSAKAMDSLTTATVNNTGVIEAKTIQNKAGRILLMGDMEVGTVNVGGTLDASAPNGGDGGFIETSAAHVKVATGTKVTTLAANGKTGTWLIDPNDFTIAASGGDMDAATVAANLANTNFQIATASMGTAGGNGDINVNQAVTWSSAYALTLTAQRNININQGITATNGALVLNAASGISAPAAVNVGTFTLVRGTWRQVGSNLPAFSATDFRISGGTFIRALGGDGLSAATAYQLSDVYGLQGADSSGMLNKKYLLANNIDASGTVNWDSGAGFNPIGDGTTAFSGTFDGNNKTINGLTINRSTIGYVGLFGAIGGAAISNVGLVGGSVSGRDGVGGLVGYNDRGTINNSYATASVTGTASRVGGLVGYNTGGTISNAYATGSVSGSDSIGGLVGYNTGGTISNAYATGSVSGASAVGGLVGYHNSGTVTASFWLNSVSTTGLGVRAGTVDSTTRGLSNAEFSSAATYTAAGWSASSMGGDGRTWRIYEGNTGPLLRSFLTSLNLTLAYDGSATLLANIGDVVIPGGTDLGQLLGTHTGSTLTLSSNGTSNSFTASALAADRYSTQQGYDISIATRTITSTGSAAGDVNVANSINYTSGALVINAAGSVSLNGISSANGSVALNAGGSITNTGATDVALFDLKGGAWSQVTSTLPAFNAADFRISGGSFLRALGGDGASAATAYQLSDVYGLQGAASAGMLNKRYTLANNIDASGTVNWNSGAGFNPIGDGTTAFSGAFDGNNKTINGLTINRPTQDNVGLFGYTSNAAISNVGLVGGSVSGRNSVGGLVGYNRAAISNAYATGSVSGRNNIGALVGENAGTISNAYATGSVSGNDYIGGLAGINWAIISNAYATGSVSGNNYIGGLVGYHTSGTVTASFWLNSVSTTGFGARVGTVDGATRGLSDAEFRSAGTYAGWSVSNVGGSNAVWRIYEGNTGPLLRSFLTAYNLTPAFDGSGTLLANIGSVVIPGGTDPGQLLGTHTGSTLTLSSNGTSNSFTASASTAGLYSTQQGYDLITATRTITSTGSAAGDVNVANSINYTSGALVINAAGSVSLNGITSANGSVAVNAGGSITNTGATDVALFDLKGGAWSQVSSNLPAFSATDFRISGGSFIRALSGSGLSPVVAYLIADIYGLQGADSSGMLGKHYRLVNNIDASGTVNWNSGAGFNPIGDRTIAFTGTFEGNNTTINGLTINRATSDYVGLFSATSSSARITNVGLVGGSVKGQHYTGALVGFNEAGISNAYATGSVSGRNNVGGLLGYNAGTISNVYATGSVSGNDYIGGLVGINWSIIRNAYATGSVLGARFVGGLVGFNYDTINNTYATGSVSGASSVGGLVGYHNSGPVTASFWLNSVSTTGFGNQLGTVDSTTRGLSDAEFRSAATYTAAGWSASNVGGDGSTWRIYEGNTGPLLRSFLTARTLTDTVVTYDGTTQAATAAGALITDASGRNAGTYASYSNQQGYDLTGGSLVINKANLTLAAVVDTKTYDGTTASTAAVSKTGLMGTDLVTALTQSFGSKDVLGAGASALTVDGGYVLNDGNNGGNYNVTRTAAAGSINKATLSVTGVVADNKTYNGTDVATLSNIGTLSGLVGGETLALSQTAATFDNKNAGTGKIVTATGYGIADGSGGTAGLASNYQLASTSATTSANIDKANLTLAAVTDSKTYDGTTASTVAVVKTGLASGDSATAAQSFGSKNVLGTGNSTLSVDAGYTITDGNGGGNYNVTTTAAAGSINKATLSVTGVVADNKTYNGTDAATLSNIGTLSGLVGGETLALSQTAATFDNKNAGTGKLVTATGYALADGTGGLASNYQLASTSATTSANIDKATLNVTGVVADNKTYNGTDVATLSNIGTLSGLVGGETLALSQTGATFDNKNAGTGKLVTATGYGIADGSGGTAGLASNYQLASTSATTSANISQANLTVSTADVVKTYDASTNALGTAVVTGGTVFSGDGLAGGSFFFASKNASVGDKVVNVSGVTVGDGVNNANYNVTYAANTTSTINKADLAVTASGVNKVYDGSTVATVGYGDNRVAGDVLGIASSASFADKNAGAGKAVNVGGISLSGADAGNYNLLNTTAGTTADINRASLAVVAGDANRMADGTPYSGGNGVSYVGLVGGDTAAMLAGSLSYGGSSQGASTAGSYDITPGGLSANGNYNLRFVQGRLTLTPGGAESSALGGTELVGAYRGSLNTLGNSGLLPHVSADDGKGNGGGDGAATALNAAAADAAGGE